MFYLKAKKLDLKSDEHHRIAVINTKAAVDEGIQAGHRLQVSTHDKDEEAIVTVELTHRVVSHYEVGLDPMTFEDMGLKEGDLVGVDFMVQPKSLEAIRKKLLRNELDYKDVKMILEDIVSGRLGDIEATYFAACGFNPGFSDKELYYLTKAMSETGEMFNWPYEKVIDKHSIGGLAGKGITPIIVSIIASKGLIIPNTSTRAITAPAGTTDVMEVFCRVEFSKEEIEKLIRKNNACLVWGGGLDLAPADEALIEIEKPLGIELYDKFIVSILAKKVAMGLTHYVLDLPCGPDTKVSNMDDVEIIKHKFEMLSKKFGIKVKVISRMALGPDGRGIGPCLEAQDILRVLQQRDDRYLPLEEIALKLAGDLLELAGEAKAGKGYEEAKKELVNGNAYKKFKKIIASQDGDPDIQVEDIKIGKVRHDVIATENGVVKDIENHTIKDVAHTLGTPTVKEAGLFIHKQVGESYKKGDVLFTLYTTSESRLDLALKILKVKKLIIS